MTRIRRAGALTAAAISLVFALSGCFGPTPTPTPTPDALPPTSAAPTPSAEPVDPVESLTTVTTLVARPEALELRDGSGAVVASLAYTSPVPEALATLTMVLGGVPESESYEGGNHNAPGVMHTWDDALVVDEIHYGEGVIRTGDASVAAPEFRVYLDAPEVRGKELTTQDGIHVGDAFDALGDVVDPDLWTCSGWAVEYVEVPDAHVGSVKYGVGLSEWAWNEAAENYGQQVDYVASILAPTSVASGCA